MLHVSISKKVFAMSEQIIHIANRPGDRATVRLTFDNNTKIIRVYLNNSKLHESKNVIDANNVYEKLMTQGV